MPHKDVLIRNAAGGFVVVDAVTLRSLAGPYTSLADAHKNACRLVSYGHVWRESVDRSGRSVGRFLLELKASSFEHEGRPAMP
jgi:hypothetical protein